MTPHDPMPTPDDATRAEGLRRLDAFRPGMGRPYASGRNHDPGPGRAGAVSRLSPYVARRIVTEEELVRAALADHGPENAAKFVEEVIWRTYFKGWLELRPQVWQDYRSGLERDRRAVAEDRGLARRLAAAEEGRTGIDCMDAWAEELAETSYLHNHARMWFASIWIFTLGLSWRLGADFFLRHLLDGDAASNTLGWRWVAGLHTPGKHYVAAGWNIRRYTGGRFSPRGLVEAPVPLDEGPLPPAGPIRGARAPHFAEPTGLLLTTEDLGVETLGPALEDVAAVATLRLTGARSDAPVAGAVAAFDARALADAAARAGARGAPALESPAEVVDWARGAGVRRIATGYLHCGWTADRLAEAAPALARAGIALEEIRRPWDDAIEPHSAAGFFKVRKRIPQILGELGLAG